MSYIIKSTSPFVSIKLTEKGREQLAQGQLNFTSWAIGDSEINYNRESVVDPINVSLSATSKIMRPFDRQPNIKTFITKNSTMIPYQPLNASNLNVVKAVVNNEAEERGFFYRTGTTFTTLTGSSYTPYVQEVSNTELSGGTTLNLTTTSGFTVNDIILIKLASLSASTTDNALPLPYLWFKVQTITPTTITVDRNLPNYSGYGVTNSFIVIYKGGEVQDSFGFGTSTAYWDSGTLSFNSNINVTCHDVPVWNMNNVWCENLAGITGLTTENLWENYTQFGSFAYLGTKNPYLEVFCLSTATTLTFDCNGPGLSYADDVVKSISIIHYTNNTISNLYGEFLYIDTTNDKVVNVYLPDLMYHRANYSTASGKTQGMRFLSGGATKMIGTSNIEYIDLIEDSTMISSASTAIVVGKVFPQLKMVVINNDEIVAALSYKSNRNWTLPALAAGIASPSGGTSTGVLGINKTIYLTYSLENTNTTGLTSSMPCQDYIKVTNTSSSAKDIAFRIGETDMLPFMRKLEAVDYDGLGFYANKFRLLYQIMDDTTTRPDPSQWKAYDFTTTGLTTNVGETIDPKLFENQSPNITGFVLDTLKDATATIFDLVPLLNLPDVATGADTLQFGDERFFYGNVGSFIGATIYKTIFDIRISSNDFNTTTNPTRSLDTAVNRPDIMVSEVGIYDASNNLVCIGKLSSPVALETGNTIMLELSMDF